MSTIMNSRRDGGCRRRMLASTVFVLAALALPTSRASAQANCQGLTSTQCAQASDQYQLLSIFSTLPSSPGGVAFLQNGRTAPPGANDPAADDQPEVPEFTPAANRGRS